MDIATAFVVCFAITFSRFGGARELLGFIWAVGQAVEKERTLTGVV